MTLNQKSFIFHRFKTAVLALREPTANNLSKRMDLISMYFYFTRIDSYRKYNILNCQSLSYNRFLSVLKIQKCLGAHLNEFIEISLDTARYLYRYFARDSLRDVLKLAPCVASETCISVTAARASPTPDVNYLPVSYI